MNAGFEMLFQKLCDISLDLKPIHSYCAFAYNLRPPEISVSFPSLTVLAGLDVSTFL